jgi:NTP pyrophosphatase (non-canonical NTP hydrolase)
MTPNEYQELAMKTCGQAEFHERLVMAAMGLAGEVGETNDHIKKWLFHSHELDRTKIASELGDIAWYLTLMCTALGLNLETVLKENIQKLQRRYPEGFSAEQSINREEYREK